MFVKLIHYSYLFVCEMLCVLTVNTKYLQSLWKEKGLIGTDSEQKTGHELTRDDLE